MASKFLRRQTWWLNLRHPVTGQVIRHSLETADSARAELLRKRIEIEVALLQPCFQSVGLASQLRSVLGLTVGGTTPRAASQPGLPPQMIVPALPPLPTIRRTPSSS